MPSKSALAPLEFPGKGGARPPADATGRAPDTTPPAAAPAPAAASAAAIAPAEIREPRKDDKPAPGQQGAALLELMGGPIEGENDLVQINVTVPRWVRTRLKILTATGQAKTIKDVTTQAVIKAVEQLLSDAGGKAKQ